MGTKKCSKCGKVKPVSEFYVKYRFTNELRAACKPCTRTNQRATSRQWKLDNPDRVAEYQRDWRRRNGLG